MARTPKQGSDYYNATEEERREFIDVLPLLRKKKLSLRIAVEFAVPRLRPDGGIQTVKKLVNQMISTKTKMFESGVYRKATLKDFKLRANKFSNSLGNLTFGDLTKDAIVDWVVSLELSNRSNKNYLGIVAEILNHAREEKLITENPLEELSTLERKSLVSSDTDNKEPEILTPAETQRLLDTAAEHPDLGLLPVLTLGAFCGLRTSELMELNWSDVRHEENEPFVTINASIAKKRRIRHVIIPPNAIHWLQLCSQKSGELIYNPYSRYYYDRLHKLMDIGEVGEIASGGIYKRKWPKNGLRDSYGTYHFALHRNPIETSTLMGHRSNDQMLFAHYRKLATKDDGENYFSIRPS